MDPADMAPLITAIDHLEVLTTSFHEDLIRTSELMSFEPVWTGEYESAQQAVYRTANLHFVLREGESDGLSVLAFRVSDMPRLQRRLKRLGIDTKPLEERDPLAPLMPAGALLSPHTDSVRGLGIMFVARDEPVTDGLNPPATESSVTGLDHIVVASSDAERTAFMLGAQLGLDMRMDRSNPDWGARLMFFRCGDLIVEVFQPLDDKERDTSIDGFYGLSWRVGNADSAQQRLSATGRDVSEVRKGRKPGTRVFTSREGNAGVPTLLIEPAA